MEYNNYDDQDYEEYIPEDNEYEKPDEDRYKQKEEVKNEKEEKVQKVEFVKVIDSYDYLISYVNDLATLFDISFDDAFIFYYKLDWKKERLEEYFDHPANFKKPQMSKKSIEDALKIFCSVCALNKNEIDLIEMRCNHQICKECMSDHLIEQKISLNSSVLPRCPHPACKEFINLNQCILHLPDERKANFIKNIAQSFRKNDDTFIWCKNNTCEYGWKKPDKAETITCMCNSELCSHCGYEDHYPVDCKTCIQLTDLEEEDKKELNRILLATTDCPSCSNICETILRQSTFDCRKCDHSYCHFCLQRLSHADHSKCRFGKATLDLYRGENKQKRKEKYKSIILLRRFTKFQANSKLLIENENKIKEVEEHYESFKQNQVDFAKSFSVIITDLEFLREEFPNLINLLKRIKWILIAEEKIQEETLRNLLNFSLGELIEKSNYSFTEIIKFVSQRSEKVDLSQFRNKLRSIAFLAENVNLLLKIIR